MMATGYHYIFYLTGGTKSGLDRYRELGYIQRDVVIIHEPLFIYFYDRHMDACSEADVV